MMSVDAARPRKAWSSLSTSSSRVTSPWASFPWVTPRTANSRRLAWTPVTRSNALKIASTGPSPIAASWTTSPSGLRTRTVAVGNGEQHVLGRGQRQAFQLDGGLVGLADRVQDKTAVGLHRAAGIDRHMLAKGWRLDVRAQLFEDIGQAQRLRTVDHQPHGTVRAVLDYISDGLREIRVGHVRHGDQEVMLEVRRGEVFHEP